MIKNYEAGKSWWIYCFGIILFYSNFTYVCGQELSKPVMDKWLIAVWKTEGGYDTSKPYGINIRSDLPYKELKERNRKIAIKTINNRYQKWLKTNKKTPFYIFLANKYCSPKVDPVGYSNWVSNMHFFLKKDGVLF